MNKIMAVNGWYAARVHSDGSIVQWTRVKSHAQLMDSEMIQLATAWVEKQGIPCTIKTEIAQC